MRCEFCSTSTVPKESLPTKEGQIFSEASKLFQPLSVTFDAAGRKRYAAGGHEKTVSWISLCHNLITLEEDLS